MQALPTAWVEIGMAVLGRKKAPNFGDENVRPQVRELRQEREVAAALAVADLSRAGNQRD